MADLMSHEEHRKSRFYKEWVQPQGWIDAIAATLEKSATAYSGFSVIRHERNGIVDDETRRRMKLIVPHVRRAVAIGKIVDLRTVEAAALADTLDGLTAAMFLVDDDGRIVHANAAGHVMLADGSVITAAGGKLIFADQQQARALWVPALRILRRVRKTLACLCGPLTGTITSPTSSRSPPGSAGRQDQPILPSQPCSSARLSFNCRIRWKTLAKRYGLTAAEMRVLFAIVEIGGVPDVANMLGISQATVKTHLQRIFDKTGTARQADLVKLVAGLAGPFGG